ALDDQFGVTHTKQGIRPSERIKTLLGSDFEKIAHKLNARVRSAFAELKSKSNCAAIRRAEERDIFLEPPVNARLRKQRSSGKLRGLSYSLTLERSDKEEFFSHSYQNGRAVININSNHPFFGRFY